MRSLAQTSSALDSLAALLPDEAERVDGDSDRHGRRRPTCASAMSSIVRPGGRVPADGADRRRRRRRRRVDDHRRVTHRAPRRRRRRRRGHRRHRLRRCGSRSPPSATTPPSPASSGWSPRPRTRRPGPSGSPTGPPAWLFWFALGAAVLTAIVWTALGQPDNAVIRTITVLVIACPHALGLAIPLVVAIATERAARGGVLVKDRLALEAMRTGRRRAVRQDRHAHPGRADRHRRRTRARPRPRRGARARRRGRGRQRASARQGDRAPPRRSGCTSGAPSFTSSPAVGVTRDGRRAHGSRSAGRTCCARHVPTNCRWPRRGADEGAIILHVLADGAVVGALRLADEVRPESRAGRRRAARARHPGRHDHRRRRGRRRGRSPTNSASTGSSPASGPRTRPPRSRELQGEGTPGRDGRRRRQRRAGAGAGRRRHRDRRRHRRRDRLGGRDPRQRRPALGAVGDRAVAGRATAR